MRRVLARAVVDFHGGQHPIGGYSAGPVPPAPVPLWLGGQGPRMLALTGRSSDGWISPLSTYLTPSAVPARQQLIDEAALAAGRDPAAVRRIYNVIGAIGAVRGGQGLTGEVQAWIDALTDWSIDLGFDTFVLWFGRQPVDKSGPSDRGERARCYTPRRVRPCRPECCTGGGGDALDGCARVLQPAAPQRLRHL